MQDLETQGLVVKVEPHTLSLGHCYRCETIIEPYLSDQWFVKMKPLAGPALDVVLDGTIKFHPERWVKTYEHWMNNIHDWCISRQLWWGHRIPVWYCIGEENCKLECKNPIVSTTKPERCPHCGSSRLRQDEDVLDTWFSSWLWPFSTLGWPRDNPDLRYFYPTDTLVTAPDIIFFWVARMIMAGLEVSGEIPLPDGSTRSRAELRVPFRDVYFTSIIRDMKGRKMSKSLGNSPDPLDVIAEYGADALRFTIIYLAPLGQDVLYSNEKCEIGRNFANKIWNAGRFLLMNKEQLNAENPGQGVDRETLEAPGGNRSEGAASGKSMPATKQAAGQTQSVIRDGKSDMPSVTAEKSTLNDGFLDLADRWILSRLHSTISDLDDALAKFEINQATKILYDFVWHDFCDWYVEMIKGRLYGDESAHVKQVVLDRALDVFDQSLRLLHPFMPFVSEELWQHLADRKSGESIMVAQYPSVDTSCIDKETEAEMAFVQNIINSVRNIRGELSVPPSKEINLIINFADNTKEDILKKYRGYFQRLARVTEIQTLRDGEKPRNAASAVVDGGEVFIPLEGLIDLAAERERIRKEVTRLQGMVDSTQKKLANESFVSRAPGDVVDKEREKLETFRANLVKLQKNLERL